jgi:purine-binding chemotaxis protein CheW
MANTTPTVPNSSLFATFRLRDAYYALDAEVVVEVIRVGEITPVAHAPLQVIGVINLRGRIVTLIDMGVSLGLAPAVQTAMSRILIVEDAGEFTGLLADEVSDVTDVSSDEIQPTPANIPLERLRYCHGVFRRSDRVVLLLDGKGLLDVAHLVTNSSTGSSVS